MTARVWLLSVPHTGTLFTMALLERMGLWVRQTHCLTVGRGWIEAGRKVVVPWRDPVLAKISEANRMTDAHASSPGYPKVTIEALRQLRYWGETFDNVHVFHVNGQDVEIDRLAAFVDRPVPDYDWTPVNRTEDQVGEPDRTGWKAAYMGGVVPEELTTFAAEAAAL